MQPYMANFHNSTVVSCVHVLECAGVNVRKIEEMVSQSAISLPVKASLDLSCNLVQKRLKGMITQYYPTMLK